MQVWDQALSGPKQQSPYLTHHFTGGRVVRDFGFCPYDDALGEEGFLSPPKQQTIRKKQYKKKGLETTSTRHVQLYLGCEMFPV